MDIPPPLPRGDAAPPLLRVLNLRKSYRTLDAVKDLSFDITPGTILGLAGPNGAGKTTTMRAICGIIPVSSGQIEIAGIDLEKHSIEAKRNVAYVPDDPRLFDSLTVREHLAFTAMSYGLGEYKEAAASLLEEFSLMEKADIVAAELSRGMRQKVAICCALLHRPKLLLFDEPLTGLDPKGIRLIKNVIRDRAAGGVSVIISSHLLSLVEDLCTDLLILRRGQCLFLGKVAEIRNSFRGQGDTLEEVFLRVTEESLPASDEGK